MSDVIVMPNGLMQSPLFEGLADQEKHVLIQGGRLRMCQRGQRLFTQGAQVTHVYVIAKGCFQLFRTNADGHEKTIDVLKSGQIMCESEILDSCGSHRTNGVSLSDSIVLECPGVWLKDTARRCETFALNLLSLVSQRAYIAELEAEQQATMSAAQLVACFLQRLCLLYKLDPRGFRLPYQKALIASRLGMEKETFSRTLVKLREHGITVEGSHVVIHDVERINEYVCDVCSVADSCATHQAMAKEVATRVKMPSK